MLHNVCEYLSDLRNSVRKEWAIQNAPPINFDVIEGLNRQEIEALKNVYSNYVRDAENGLFDEPVQSQYRKFLTRQGFEAPQIEKSIRDLINVSCEENIKIRRKHISTQDEYWSATGLSDTRQTIAGTIIPGRFD